MNNLLLIVRVADAYILPHNELAAAAGCSAYGRTRVLAAIGSFCYMQPARRIFRCFAVRSTISAAHDAFSFQKIQKHIVLTYYRRHLIISNMCRNQYEV